MIEYVYFDVFAAIQEGIRPDTALYGIYLLVFGAAAVASFGTIGRAKRISNDGTRRGLVALLGTSGLWAALHVGYLAAPTPNLQYGFYTAGLVVGLSTVGPWLYFCSAYTGRTLHRNPTYQRVAIGGYLLIVAVKLTNPFHGLYFTARPVTTPFPHLLIDHHVFHYVAMGVAYALAVVGIFMLFELFVQVDYDTRPFGVLVGLTALPVVLDIAGSVSPRLLDLSYSALGVAIFAVGVLVIYIEEFETIQLAGQYDDPVIVVDDEDEIRDYNGAALALFPRLQEAIDEELASVAPKIAVSLTTEEPLECCLDGETRYYSVSTNQFSTGTATLGRLILLKDITERERYRLELETQNARLEQFTGMVSHDLRNPLNIAKGNVDLARETGDDEALDTVKSALDRMEDLIEDLLALARQGKPIDETERVSLAEIVRDCWEMVDVADADLAVEGDMELAADPDRLQQLFENLFRNSVEHGSTSSQRDIRADNSVEHGSTGSRAQPDDSVEHGSTSSQRDSRADNSVEHGSTSSRTQSGDSVDHGSEGVTIMVGPLADQRGFYVEDTGPGIPEDEQSEIFESGYTTSRQGTGFGLSIVTEIVEAHGWSIGVSTGDSGGARFEIETGGSDSIENESDDETEADGTVDRV